MWDAGGAGGVSTPPARTPVTRTGRRAPRRAPPVDGPVLRSGRLDAARAAARPRGLAGRPGAVPRRRLRRCGPLGRPRRQESRRWPPRLLRLAERIGMDTGPVVIADGGEVFGETANVAARVQSAAEPDTVVITAATQRLVAGIFAIEDRGPQALKGVREPVTLYRVVRPSGVRGRLAVAAARLT